MELQYFVEIILIYQYLKYQNCSLEKIIKIILIFKTLSGNNVNWLYYHKQVS